MASLEEWGDHWGEGVGTAFQPAWLWLRVVIQSGLRILMLCLEQAVERVWKFDCINFETVYGMALVSLG